MYVLMNVLSYHALFLVQLAVIALPVGDAPYIVERCAPPCMLLSKTQGLNSSLQHTDAVWSRTSLCLYACTVLLLPKLIVLRQGAAQ